MPDQQWCCQIRVICGTDRIQPNVAEPRTPHAFAVPDRCYQYQSFNPWCPTPIFRDHVSRNMWAPLYCCWEKSHKRILTLKLFRFPSSESSRREQLHQFAGFVEECQWCLPSDGVFKLNTWTTILNLLLTGHNAPVTFGPDQLSVDILDLP